MSDPGDEKGDLQHFSIAVLGILTICVYGSWYYAFGVLLDPIRLDTGWSESALAAAFSAGTVLLGFGSLAGGRLLDRVGHRVVFLVGGLTGGGTLLATSFANNIATFVALSAVALGATGALGFYHVTMTTAVRLNPTNSGKAIMVLTIWGAFASAIFLPGTSWLESEYGWRITTRVLAVALLAAFWTAAVVLPSAPESESAKRESITTVIGRALRTREGRLFGLAVAFAGVAMATILVYQVPAMTAAGLPAGTAATVAGLRGVAQTGGRIPIGFLLRRLGSDRSLALAFSAMAVGGALLSISGRLPVAILFALVAGFGVGAFTPLQGIKAEELFDRETLGATMGFFGALLVLCGSIGPFMAGLLAEQTGDRRWASIIVVISALGALGAIKQLEGPRALVPPQGDVDT